MERLFQVLDELDDVVIAVMLVLLRAGPLVRNASRYARCILQSTAAIASAT